METDALEVKRQMDRQGDKIRVMTVHGAKGLEAPIVILPDTKKIQEKVRENFVPAGDHLLWKTAGHQLPQALQDAKQDIIAADDRESMRLLYVAATRAEKWLIICGAGKISAGDESWYSVLADGVEQSGAIDVAANGQTLRRVMSGDWDAGPMTTVDVTKPGAVAAPVFDALPVVMRPVVLSPSDLGGAKVLPGDPSEGDLETALARGQLVHLLLEHLPAMTAQDRRAAGARLVASLETPVADADTLVDDVVALLGRPDLAHLFAPGALAEVGVSADVAVLGGRIFGAIDRLIIDDARVLAIDFKTNRLVPDTPDAVPEGVLRQMGAYRHALLQIYPDRAVDTAILWTQTGQLMPLPGNLVSAALARVTAP
jgi:ATP-dependent helicase/nuclease subunit A